MDENKDTIHRITSLQGMYMHLTLTDRADVEMLLPGELTRFDALKTEYQAWRGLVEKYTKQAMAHFIGRGFHAAEQGAVEQAMRRVLPEPVFPVIIFGGPLTLHVDVVNDSFMRLTVKHDTLDLSHLRTDYSDMGYARNGVGLDVPIIRAPYEHERDRLDAAHEIAKRYILLREEIRKLEEEEREEKQRQWLVKIEKFVADAISADKRAESLHESE